MQVALQSVDEVLELRDGRLRLTREQIRQVAVSILLGELLRELPDVGHRLVQRVTVVNDSTGRMSGDLQLALKERNSIGEGRYLGQCDVGDLLRHDVGKGVLTAHPNTGGRAPLSYNIRKKRINGNINKQTARAEGLQLLRYGGN